MNARPSDTRAPAHEVLVWDPLVRIFHWALVLAFAVAFVTEDEWLTWHVLAGYTVLGLVLFRLLWGVIGTRHARFTDFVYPPAVIRAYFRDLWRLQPPRYLGHNPAGGLMVILFLLSLLATILTGLAAYGAEEQAGPLAEIMAGTGKLGKLMEAVHEFCANFTLGLVVLHGGGVFLASLRHRENLVWAMITGRKRV